MVRLGRAAALAVLAAVLAFGPTAAEAADSIRYARSKSPYWRVGQLDRNLSEACRRGEFNQMRDLRLHIGFQGEVGPATTGIAKKGWNLRDPRNLGLPGFTFHFFNDGYSNCRVYVAAGR